MRTAATTITAAKPEQHARRVEETVDGGSGEGSDGAGGAEDRGEAPLDLA